MNVKLPPSKGIFISMFNRKCELREPLEDVAQRGGAGRTGHELDLLSSPRDRGEGGEAGLDQQLELHASGGLSPLVFQKHTYL